MTMDALPRQWFRNRRTKAECSRTLNFLAGPYAVTAMRTVPGMRCDELRLFGGPSDTNLSQSIMKYKRKYLRHPIAAR